MTIHTPFIGVNLGGWLILEKWLTPSVFEGMDASDEWGLSQTEAGRRRIRHHRKTFITEDDFAWLHEHDITYIRLPVPYWAIVETDDYIVAADELAWAMAMAEKYGLKVLLDLHAVPGGQNPGEHSGKRGQMEWFDGVVRQEETIEVLKAMATAYYNSPALWGIEIMNEPAVARRYWQVARFYRRAYRELQEVLRPGVYTVFHDGFSPLLFMGSVRALREFPVAMDVHWYGFPLRYIKKRQTYFWWSKMIRTVTLWIAQRFQPVIIGEWSSVMPQRFFDAVPQDHHMDLLKENIEIQLDAYRPALGSMYWNYKAEGDGMWNLRWLIENEDISLE